MDMHVFEKLVADVGLSPVPEKFRDLIQNVALLIEEDVPPETRRELDLSPHETLLGLYKGIPQTSRDDSYGLGVLPDTITLYRLPIVRAAKEDGVPVRHVVEETIWHEVAHHFGLDEDQVASAELRRKK